MPVVGHEEFYDVSSKGRVRSRSDCRRARGSVKILSCAPNGSGRPHFVATSPTRRDLAVHVVVLESFVGLRPSGMQASHLNGNRVDNRVCNLDWETPKKNTARKKAHGTHEYGECHSRARITEEVAEAILLACAEFGSTHDEIAVQFETTRDTVSDIARRKSWKHLRPDLRRVYRNSSAKITEKSVAQIKAVLRSGRCTHREIASVYGIDRSTVTAIASGKNWGWVK